MQRLTGKLGYFHVAGISEKRIFVDRPLALVKFHYSICDLDDADVEAYSQMGMADPVLYPLFAVESPGGRRATPPKKLSKNDTFILLCVFFVYTSLNFP